MISRRGFISGLSSIVAAPAIVRIANIMPVKAMPDEDLLIRMMLSKNEYLGGLSQQIASTIIYGNPKWAPINFSGFLPRYSA